MFNILLNSIKGVYTVEVTGRFPERMLNIASVSGIYLRDVQRKDSQTISFCISKKAYEKLIDIEIEGIMVTLTNCYGVPVFFRKHKKRMVLLMLPLLFVAASFIFSLFVWKVEITGGDKLLQEKVLNNISQKGVRVGALKRDIDQYDIKRTSIMEIDDLSWLWVDLKGTTAKIKIQPRTLKPDIIPVNEPSDVISVHSGIVEKMQVYCGVPLVKEGDSVEKGQVVVTGIFRSENENIPTYYHHATADVTVRFMQQKTVIIPKTTIKKVPTGKKKSVFGVKSEKKLINFSLNSRISYKEYDKIEKTYALRILPLSFFKAEYQEVIVEHAETNIPEEIEMRRKTFLGDIQKDDIEILNLTESVIEKDNHLEITFYAECLGKADKEIPIHYETIDSEGEQNGENS